MSVEAIRLKNFMAFQDTGWIELRPITLLFGKNSSGKSVVGRALRLLKQSLGAEAGSGPFVYATRQGVDVGDFKAMIHTSPVSPDWPKPVVFVFRCRLTDTLDHLVRLINQQFQREGQPGITAAQAQDQVEVWLQYEYKWEDEPEDVREPPRLTQVEITYPRPEQGQHPPLTVFAADRLDEQYSTEDEWWFYSDILHGHEVDQEPVWTNAQIELVSGFLPTITTPKVVPESSAASYEDLRFVADLLRKLRETIEQFLRHTDYLGPLRPAPERVFVLDAQRIRDWENSGLRGYLTYLRGKADEEVRLGIGDEINCWLQRLGLCHSARYTSHYEYDDRALVASVDIYETEGGEPRNLADVGFGLSQVLPVIVQCLVADSGSTLLVEQPELHLHPEAQATLADLLIDCVNRDGPRFVFETHSEHLLLRLQRRIAETTYERLARSDPPKNQEYKLRPEDLRVILINRTDGKSQIENIQTDHRGQLVNPSAEFRDFFKEDYEDVMKLTRATSGIMALESKDDDRDN